MNEQDLIVVYSAGSSQEAHLLKGLLAQRDIAAVVQNDALQSAAGGLHMGNSLAPNVVVAAADLPKAREVVIAFRRQQEIGPPQVDDVFPQDDEEWDLWPLCPECREPRTTVCQTCGETGSDFPPADFQIGRLEPAVDVEPTGCGCGDAGGCSTLHTEQPAAAEEDAGEPVPTLVRCESCDEVFTPRFYRVCARCGHDFGSGMARQMTPDEPLNGRTRAVLAGLGVTAFAVVVYLLYVLSR
jgi:hypothetical protein